MWLIPLVVLLFLGGFGAALVVTGLVGGKDEPTAATSAAASGDSPQTEDAGAGTPAGAPTTAEPPVTVPTLTPPTSTDTTSAPPEPVTLPADARVCGTRPDYGPVAYAASGNNVTSCPFALNVQEAYVLAGGVDGTVVAHSPVTKRNYSMDCTGAQPVICRGGNNAVVLLFEGEPRR